MGYHLQAKQKRLSHPSGFPVGLAQALVDFRHWLRLLSIFTRLSFRQFPHQTGRLIAMVSGCMRCFVGLPQIGQRIFPSVVTILPCFPFDCNVFPPP